MLKSDIRKLTLKQRKAFTADELFQFNQQLLSQFKRLNLSKVKSIHLFLPIVKLREPNTFLIINWLQQSHPEITIVVPKADFNSGTMTHYQYIGEADLKNNAYHIPEPSHAPVFKYVPDLVIVPLLAVDERGYRVGYGKGFYDRFLQSIQTRKVGLSFFEPIPEIIDVHLNDVRLDQCITPHGVIDFNVLNT